MSLFVFLSICVDSNRKNYITIKIMSSQGVHFAKLHQKDDKHIKKRVGFNLVSSKAIVKQVS